MISESLPPMRTTQSRGTCAAPAWSPDGRWIAYFDNQCPGTAYTQDHYLWLAPTGGGAARNVSQRLDRGCQITQPPSVNQPPHWSGDSETVFFHVREGGFWHYYAYHLADDQLRPVRAPRDVLEPVDGLVRQSADGGLLAFCAATSASPSELFASGLAGLDCRQLTDLNADVLSSIEVCPPRRLEQTSPEGWGVESWLWLPPS